MFAQSNVFSPQHFNCTTAPRFSRRTSLAVQDPEESSPYAGLRRRSSAAPIDMTESPSATRFPSRRSSIYNERLPGVSHLLASPFDTLSQRRGSRAEKAHATAREQPSFSDDPRQSPFSSRAASPVQRLKPPRPEQISTSLLSKARVSIGTIPMTMRDLLAKRKSKSRYTAARAIIRLGALFTIIYLVAKLIGAMFPASPLASLPSVVPKQLPYILDALPLPQFASALLPGMAKPTQSPRRNAAIQAERRKLMMKRFREEMLWKVPDSPIATKVIKEAIGHHHENTVIFLHGLGEDAWTSPLPKSLAERFGGTRWVHPQAPRRPISFLDGQLRSAWYDLFSIPDVFTHAEDEGGIYESARHINAVIRVERTKLIKQLRQRGGVNVADSDQAYTYMVEPLSPELEHAGETAEEQAWASKRIVLAGFSQGAVLSLVTGLTAENDLAGLVILSGYMPIKARLQQISQDMGRESMPVFWGHGMKDNVLLHSEAETSIAILREPPPLGLAMTNIDFQTYGDVGHEIWCSGDALEIRHLGDFLARVLPQGMRVKEEDGNRRPVAVRRNGKVRRNSRP